MEKDAFVLTLREQAFADYSRWQASEEQISKFSVDYFSNFGAKVDKDYISLLSLINGFEINGLNFYGTAGNEEVYVQGFFEQNQFWRSEIPGLLPYAVLGDGDMEFYLKSLTNDHYLILSKGELTQLSEVYSLNDLLTEISSSYF
jgi:hypothetical protein